MRHWSCLCCILFWVALVALVSVVIWFFCYWLDYHRHGHVQFTVDDASLARFDLDPATGALRHNLTLAVSVRNGDKSAVYYTRLEAAAYFGGSEFGFQSLRRFSQWQKTTTQIFPSFQGQTRLNGGGGAGGSSVLPEFARERGEGYYAIDVKFHAEIRVEWDVKDWDGGSHTRSKGYSPEVDCWLRLPVTSNGSSPSSARGVNGSIRSENPTRIRNWNRIRITHFKPDFLIRGGKLLIRIVHFGAGFGAFFGALRARSGDKTPPQGKPQFAGPASSSLGFLPHRHPRLAAISLLRPPSPPPCPRGRTHQGTNQTTAPSLCRLPPPLPQRCRPPPSKAPSLAYRGVLSLHTARHLSPHRFRESSALQVTAAGACSQTQMRSWREANLLAPWTLASQAPQRKAESGRQKSRVRCSLAGVAGPGRHGPPPCDCE